MKPKPGWLVKTQIQRRGKWIDPLPGMGQRQGAIQGREEAIEMTRTEPRASWCTTPIQINQNQS